ncbi:MAG: hypothetical protein MZV63_27955 [Marinilabiliales bacterium]|nr:hypothetical protein [Marinilabiliales bacterium]
MISLHQATRHFGRPAFDAYLRMVSVAPLTPERKLLLVRDIAPLCHGTRCKD